MKRIKKEDLILLINKNQNYYIDGDRDKLPELMRVEDNVRALYKLSFSDVNFISDLSRFGLKENKTHKQLIGVLELLDIEVYD